MKRLRDWFRRRPDWCPQSPLLAWLWDPWFTVAAGVAAVVGAGLLATLSPWAAGLLAAGALLGWPIWRQLRRGERQGWRVDEQGLWELRWDAAGWVRPWDSIEQLIDTPEMLAVVVDGHVLMLPQAGPAAARLAQALHARLDPPSAAAEALPAESIASWLGIEVDGTLELWVPAQQRRRMIVALAVIGPLILILLLRTWRDGVQFAAFWPLLILLTWPPVLQPVARATAWGVRGRRRSASWDEIQQAVPQMNGWLLKTRDGSIYLPLGPDSDRVAETVRKVVAARRGGQRLPRLADVPAHAISRAKATDGSAARGISRVKGDDR